MYEDTPTPCLKNWPKIFKKKKKKFDLSDFRGWRRTCKKKSAPPPPPFSKSFLRAWHVALMRNLWNCNETFLHKNVNLTFTYTPTA